MARPIQDGLRYFPLDVDADYDDKVQLIEGLHGAIGIQTFMDKHHIVPVKLKQTDIDKLNM